jgi:hypothetical protein
LHHSLLLKGGDSVIYTRGWHFPLVTLFGHDLTDGTPGRSLISAGRPLRRSVKSSDGICGKECGWSDVLAEKKTRDKKYI